MRRSRLRHDPPESESNSGAAFEQRDLTGLTGLFAPPRWLRDLGATAWLAVGVTLLLVGAVWLLSLTDAIVMPVIAAAVIAAVAGPLVSALRRRGVPRGIGAALLLVGVVVLGVAIVVLVLAAVVSQRDDLSGDLSAAQAQLSDWLVDLGVDKGAAENARHDVASAVGDAVPALLHGVARGLASISSLVVFLALTTLSLFFLLKDGPAIRAFCESHLRVPAPVAHQMTGRVLQSLRGYFVGVTAVALFNGVVVTLGALLLGVPLPGALGVVTFLGAYVPYLGAWGAGLFAVLIALGGAGPDAAVGMAVVQLLANGILQQLVQPVAYGAALGIHPLAVLIVTIAGGSLFGAVGLILAAPLTSAAARIAADLAREGPSGEAAERAEPAGPGGSAAAG